MSGGVTHPVMVIVEGGFPPRENFQQGGYAPYPPFWLGGAQGLTKGKNKTPEIIP